VPDVTLVDPDAIARKGGLTPIGGGRAALALIESTIARRGSLLVETTLAGRNAFRYIAAARSSGYLMQLLYIGTEDVSIDLRRIRERVVRGGHDIPAADVRRR
jgi:predicted ABC-type ATPase